MSKHGKGTMKAKHAAAGEWKLDHDPWNDTNTVCRVDDDGFMNRIAIMADRKDADQLAAFIVRACNSHNSLLEALTAARDYMDAFGCDNDMAPTMEKIEAAIRKAQP